MPGQTVPLWVTIASRLGVGSFVEARRAIDSRIFLAHQIRHENVLERWQLLSGEKDWPRMVEFWNSLHSALIAAAH